MLLHFSDSPMSDSRSQTGVRPPTAHRLQRSVVWSGGRAWRWEAVLHRSFRRRSGDCVRSRRTSQEGAPKAQVKRWCLIRARQWRGGSCERAAPRASD